MSDASEDTGLVRRALAGEVAAVEEIVRRLQDPIYRLALRMAGQPADAEDAAQEILIRVITRLAAWRGEAALLTWAYRIAVNYLLNLRRTPLERQKLTFESLGDRLADGLADADYAGPEAEVLAEEIRLSCTQAMLQCLDRDERITVVLADVFLLPSEEAGWILDIGAAAYRKRLARARQRIRGFMSQTCGLVNPDAACRCARRVEPAIAVGRLDPTRPVFARHPTVADGRRQMHQLHDAAAVLRSHPAYAAPRSRSEAIMALLRSGRFSMLTPD